MRRHVGSLAWRPVEGVAGPRGREGAEFCFVFFLTFIKAVKVDEAEKAPIRQSLSQEATYLKC